MDRADGSLGRGAERRIIPAVSALTAVLVPLYVIVNWDNCNCPCPELSSGSFAPQAAEGLRSAMGVNCSAVPAGRS